MLESSTCLLCSGLGGLRENLARKLTVADLRHALAWFDSAAGRRVTLAEESAAAHMTEEALERGKSKPASPKRALMLADLAAATAAPENGADLVEAMALGLAVGIDATRPAQQRLGTAKLRERLRAAMPTEKLRAELRASLPAMLGFTYRNVSDADLAAYLAFNSSLLGNHYNYAVRESLGEALARATVRVGELVQSALEKKRI